MQLVLSRRSFGRVALVGTAGVAIPTLSGCNASQWIQTALADLPTILQIITSILAIVSKGAVPPALLAEVNKYGAEAQKDLTLAQTLITQYQAQKTTDLLSKIDAAMVSANQNLTAILAAFHIGDPNLQAAVAASLGAAITIVLAIHSLIPAPPAAASSRVALAKSAQKDGNEIMKEAFNLVVKTTGHPEAQI